jgi:hypothetical protein
MAPTGFDYGDLTGPGGEALWRATETVDPVKSEAEIRFYLTRTVQQERVYGATGLRPHQAEPEAVLKKYLNEPAPAPTAAGRAVRP